MTLPESHERVRAMEAAEMAWADLANARTYAARAAAIGRMRLAMDRLADAHIAERYAIASSRTPHA